jgi:hypothetical protein
MTRTVRRIDQAKIAINDDVETRFPKEETKFPPPHRQLKMVACNTQKVLPMGMVRNG